MKKTFAIALFSVFSIFPQAAFAAPVNFFCELVDNVDWVLFLKVEDHELLSAVYSNRKGTIVSSLQVAVRENAQTFAGATNYLVGEQRARFYVSNLILDGHAGSTLIETGRIEMGLFDSYECKVIE